MRAERWIPTLVVAAVGLVVGPAGAQEEDVPSPDEVEVAPSSFEMARYSGGGRDPFVPLTDQRASGEDAPRFQELTLTGVFVGAPGRSLAVLEDENRRGHFLRVGQTIGDARLIEILPDAAIFEVNEYGAIRREILRLERDDRRREGDEPRSERDAPRPERDDRPQGGQQ